jgi:hypothetical protein
LPSQFARRGQARFLAAIVILGAWGAGLTALVQREFFQGRPQRLAEAALRLSPTATFFAVERSGKVIGFASTTIDTVAGGIDAIDYLVADLSATDGKGTERTSTRSVVKLSRALTFRSFETEVDSRDAPSHAAGRADGDSAIVYVKFTGTEPADSQRVRVKGPVMLPAVIPIAIALGSTPRVGRTYSLPAFDPATMTSAAADFRIGAESLFTLVDSARFDEDKSEWVEALKDTVRAWHVERAGSTDGGSEWVDAQGRIVQAVHPDGLVLKRTAYELAFENWRIARDRATAASAGTEDIQERTAIAAGAKVGRSKLFSMMVKLGAPRFAGYDLDGGRQHFSGDTLTVAREKEATIGAGVARINDMFTPVFRQRFRNELAAAPTLQIHDGEVAMLALKIVGLDRDPKIMVQKLTQWVTDSVKSVATFSVPNAVAVARSRRGDCNEHTQLLVALTRAIGIPSRFVSGLLYVNGKFYYHAWPEVWLGEWVAVDPTFGQFPADAAHLRFVIGGQSRQNELLQLMGNLTIKVLEAK